MQEPSRPRKPERPAGEVTIDRLPNGSLTVHCEAAPEPDEAFKEAERAYALDLKAWQDAQDLTAERSGLRAAQQGRDDVVEQMLETAAALTEARATTMQALAAKARVAVAIDPDGLFSNE